MNYFKFIRYHGSMLSFGILMTFLSSFGQTFLIALYVPFFLEDFGLKNSQLSIFYGIATIGSAFLLPYIGKFIDRVNIRYYTLWTTLFFIISLIFLSLNYIWWLLPLGLFGMRLSGQGLFSHISITSMSKFFDDGRGKAISLASLGHALGEAILPLTVLGVIGLVGWRASLLVNAGMLLLIVPVFIFFLIKDKHLVVKEVPEADLDGDSSGIKKLSQWEIISSKNFWVLAPNVFIFSCLITTLFFYQFPIAEYKGWDIELVAIGLTVYAVTSSVFILVIGPLIDRFSAKRFFPFYLIPFFLGLLLVSMSSHQFTILAYMLLLGISGGLGNALKSALQVEFFGASYIGSVRSLFSSLMVMSTAVGPALAGIFLDAGYSFNQVFLVAALIVLVVIVQSFRIMPSFTFHKVRYKLKAYFS